MSNHPKLAQYARKVAQATNEAPYKQLSSPMCWNAVFRCAMMSKHLWPHQRWHFPQEKSLNQNTFKDWLTKDGDSIKRASVEPQGDYLDLANVAQGAVLGFVYHDDPQTAKHAMLYVGNCEAAGNKNDCIGVGSIFGWEVLHLRLLHWQGDGTFLAPSTRGLAREACEIWFREL